MYSRMEMQANEKERDSAAKGSVNLCLFSFSSVEACDGGKIIMLIFAQKVRCSDGNAQADVRGEVKARPRLRND
jgi:hypothetical protein